MTSAIRWTPLLRDADNQRASANPLPRTTQTTDEPHPLAPPRLKQRVPRTALRPRRASPGRTGPAVAAAAAAVASAASFTSGIAGTDDADPLLATKDTTAITNRLERGGGSDPLSPPVGRSSRSVGGSALLFVDKDDRDVKVAEAGLSDDPLSIMMEEMAVARNISRHSGDFLDSDLAGGTIITPSRSSLTLASSDGADVKGGGGSLEDVQGRPGLSSRAAATTAMGMGRGQSDVDEGEEGRGGGWGKRWEAHRQEMLREFGGTHGTGADRAAGPATSSAPTTRAPEPPRTRYDTRLEELEGIAAGGNGSRGGDAGGVGGSGDRAKNVAGVIMAGSLLLTPKEYTGYVAELKSELENAWSKEEKVSALKLTVQAAKLIGDVSVPTFYPALFSSISGVLEAFGSMVFDRIRARAEDPGEDALTPPSPPSGGDKGEANAPAVRRARHALPEGWTCEDVGAEARETCRNWFYKTACIRELLPRLLVEAALLPCYRFLAAEDEFPQILGRLSTLVRGVGDPMVAVYCRCFIAAAGARIAPRETAHAVASLQDYLFSLQEVQMGKLSGYLRSNELGMSDYLHLHVPAVDWLLRVVGPGATRESFTEILAHYRNHCGNLEVLRLIVTHFSPDHYAPFALEMALLIKQGHELTSRCTTADMMALLGRRLRKMQPSGPDAVPLLNEAWQEIATAPLDVYVEGATAWLEVILNGPAYGPDEVAILVEDVACRVEGASPSELSGVQVQLAEGVVGTLAKAEDASALEAAGDYVVAILNALDKHRRAQACLDLLATYLRVIPSVSCSSSSSSSKPLPASSSTSSLPGSFPGGDQLLVAGSNDDGGGGGGGGGVARPGMGDGVALALALVGVAKLLHDSLDVLAGGERQRQRAADLTCDLVDRVGRGWGRQPEKGEKEGAKVAGGRRRGDEGRRLAVLAECRKAFWGMDEVTDRLVVVAVGLAMRACRAGSNSTARAALCFCSLTVPSIPSALRRLTLLQLCANAAIKIGRPALGDALFRSAICVVPECSPLVVSGADSSAAASSRGRLSPTPDPESLDGAAGGDDAWNSLGVAGRGLGRGRGAVRKEHAGAWLLAGAVRGLLGSLVAAPGHPDLGAFYLLRGLLKALRRLPWPAGSGLLASLYVTAAGTLCTMWQERLPYSICTVCSPSSFSSATTVDSHPDDDVNAVAPVPATTDVAGGAATGTLTGDGKGDGEKGGVIMASSLLVSEGEGGGGGGEGGGEVGCRYSAEADANAGADDAKADDAAGADGGGGAAAADAADDTGADIGKDDVVGVSVVVAAGDGDTGGDDDHNGERQGGGEGGGGGGDHAEDDGCARSPAGKVSWLEVGGVLGTDELYLRNSSYLREVQGLLSDVIGLALRELEELREQGEAEMASVLGGDQARLARVRYTQVTLDLVNQLVSNVHMEGGAATVVTFLIEASAGAGAREITRGAASGSGGARGSSSGYFEHTVDFVAGVARMGLYEAREEQRQSDGSVEAEEREEACLTLLQGLSGFSQSE